MSFDRAPAPLTQTPPPATAAVSPAPDRGPLQWFADFYWAYFLARFCRHLPLLAVLLAVVGMLAGVVGAEYGVRAVIFYDDPDPDPRWPWLKPACVGAAFAAVVLAVLSVGYLLATRTRGRPADPVGFPLYAAGIVLCLAVTAAAVAAVELVPRTGLVRVLGGDPAATDAPPPPAPPVRWVPFAAGFVIDLAAAAGLAWWWKRYARERFAAAVWWVAAGLDGRRVGAVRDRLADPPADGRVWPRLFAVGLAAQGFAAYLLVTYLGSQVEDRSPAVVGGLLTAAGLVVWFLVRLNLVLFPGHVAALIRAARSADPTAETDLGGWTGPVFLAAGLAAIGLLSLLSATRSPAVAGCALLFAVAAGYGLLSAVSRRAATPVVLVGLGLAAVVGGINPYKMRFPGLDYPARTADLLDLPAVAARDAKAQEEYDDRLAALMADPDYGRWEADRRQLEADRLTLDLEVRDEKAGPGRTTQLDGQRDRLAAEIDRLERKHGLPDFHAAVAGRPTVTPVKDPRREAKPPPARPGTLDLLSVGDVAFGPFDDRPPGPGRRQPLVLVTVSGGGIRSAAWTLTVLHELEEAFAAAGIDFAGHVRLICGASGGMLGAAEYVVTLDPRDRRVAAVRGRDAGWADARREARDGQYRAITGDFLTPLMNTLVYHDAPAWLSPWKMPTDRGRALEAAWADRLGPPMNTTFAALRDREAAGDVPSLVFSPMLIEDGRRLLVTNLDMRHVASNDSSQIVDVASDPHGGKWRPNHDRTLSQESFELFRLFPGKQADFQVGTAVRMSASFPFFSPAVPLPTSPRRRVVDAGYYDNYGVSLAAGWLFSGKHREWILERASKVVLVQIRDGSTERHRRLHQVDPDGSTDLSRAVEELTSPPEGLYNARVASSSFRNDGQLELLSNFFRDAEFSPDRRRQRRQPAAKPAREAAAPPPVNDRFFTTAVFEYEGSASLNWYLTGAERQMIRDPGAEGHRDLAGVDPATLTRLRDAQARRAERMRELIRWWNYTPDRP